MNKRLVWNFEIKSDCQLKLPETSIETASDVHWESRFFWPEKDIITLSGLDESFLELSRYKIKHRTDCYYILPNEEHNVKKRRHELVYKPLVNRTRSAIAYGKKIKLEDDLKYHTLMQKITDQGQTIHIDKEALIYKFQSHPSTKLELARLVIHKKIFFTLCIEAPELTWVEHITRQLTNQSISVDYVTFLKQQMSQT